MIDVELLSFEVQITVNEVEIASFELENTLNQVETVNDNWNSNIRIRKTKISIRKEAEVKLEPSATLLLSHTRNLFHIWRIWREKIAHCTRTGNIATNSCKVTTRRIQDIVNNNE